jgi:hypothetical protein
MSLSNEEWEKKKDEYNRQREKEKLLELTSAKPPPDTGWGKISKKRFVEGWEGASTVQKLILVHLRLYANKFGKCWPSTRRIAAETGLDQRTIVRNLKVLAKKEFLIKVKSDGRHNAYQLLK